MEIKELKLKISSRNLAHMFYKNNYKYKIYIFSDKITIDKENIKTKECETQSFEII